MATQRKDLASLASDALLFWCDFNDANGVISTFHITNTGPPTPAHLTVRNAAGTVVLDQQQTVPSGQTNIPNGSNQIKFVLRNGDWIWANGFQCSFSE